MFTQAFANQSEVPHPLQVDNLDPSEPPLSAGGQKCHLVLSHHVTMTQTCACFIKLTDMEVQCVCWQLLIVQAVRRH